MLQKIQRIGFSLAFLLLFVSVSSAATVPLPIGQQDFSYDPVESPTKNIDPSLAKPVAVGDVAAGKDTLDLHVVLEQFSGPVDVYFAIYAPSVSTEVWFFNTYSYLQSVPANNWFINTEQELQPIPPGLARWKENTTGPIDEVIDNSVFSAISSSGLAPGTYQLYFFVAPPGDLNNYYLYRTSFVIPPKQLAVPTGYEYFVQPSVNLPIISTIPSNANPIGVGPVAAGEETLTLRVGIPDCSEPVDVYLGIYAPVADPYNIYLFTPSLELKPLSEGLIKWKENVTARIFENLMGDIPTSILPAGTYTLYAVFTPAGRLDSYYIWETSFSLSTLTVDKFGEGTITSNVPGISCGEDCSESYQPGTTVVLTATPAEDEYFHHWTGCDSVSENSCTITINRNTTVYAAFASTKVTIYENVKVLDAATMQHFVKQEGSIYYFGPLATVIKGLQAGDIIVTALDGGFLLKVLTVSVQPDGFIAVDTEEASLEDVIVEGTIILTKELTHDDLESIGKQIQGVTLLKPEAGFSKQFTFNIDQTIRGVKIGGSVTMGFTLDVALRFKTVIGIPTGVKEFRSIVTIKSDSSLSAESAIRFAFDEKIKIFDAHLTDFIIMIGPVPVVLSPSFVVYTGIRGKAESAVKTSLNASHTIKGGIRYTNKHGWEPVKDYHSNYSFQPPYLTRTVDFKAYISPEFSLKVYKFAGPYANLEGYLGLQAGLSAALWMKLYAGIAANAGIEAKIKIWKIEFGKRFNYQLFNIETVLATSTYGGTLTVTPTADFYTTGFQGGPFSPSEKTYTLKNTGLAPMGWSVSAPIDWVFVMPRTSGTLLDGESTTVTVKINDFAKSLSRGDHKGTIAFTNTTTHEGDETRKLNLSITIEKDDEAPTIPTNLTANAVSKSEINLSWSASTDNVGVKGYKVYRDGVYFKQVTSTSASSTGLQQLTEYCYTVLAFDEAGNESGMSTQACSTTLGGGVCTPSSVVVNPAAISKSISQGSQLEDTIVTVKDNCGSPLSYTVTAVSGSWISSPQVGHQGTGTLTLKFNTANLTSGSYAGTVTIGSPSLGTAQIVISLSVSGACIPALISPISGAVLDNGCKYGANSIIWDFDWSDCPGATQYHLYVILPGAQTPVIDNSNITTSSFHYDSLSGYIEDVNRFGWKWKVRAMVNGVWGPWSSERTFDVEPLNTDCPVTACVPTLISPAEGAIMDNGCFWQSDPDLMIWDFDWSDCPEATGYTLFVDCRGTSGYWGINYLRRDITTSSFHYEWDGYTEDTECRWRVRAVFPGDVFGTSSEYRYFNIEPKTTDCEPPV